MSSVDDLVGTLFPGEKLPPPTTSGTTTANQSYESQLEKIQEQNRRQLGQHLHQQQKAVHSSFDDSEDENSPRRQTAAAAMINNNNNNNVRTSSVPKTNNIASTSTTTVSSTIPKTTTTMTTRPSAIWPTLPKNLLRACDEGTVILTNNVPQRDIQTHQRVLFPTSSSSPSTPTTTTMTQDEIMEQRDATIVGGLAGEVQYCSYIRCKKCGHPVVRLQNAYVKAPQNKRKGSSTTSPSQPQEPSQTDDEKKKKEKSSSSGGGHNFDDSSDEDDDQQQQHSHQAQPITSSASSSGAAGGLLDEMYMLCRNHYPDFLALERTGQLKRKYDCALYWCQCTLASVCFGEHRRVQMKMNPVAAAVLSSLSGTNTSNNENGKLLDVLSEEVVTSKLDGEAPYSMKDISWECTGHHKPLM